MGPEEENLNLLPHTGVEKNTGSDPASPLMCRLVLNFKQKAGWEYIKL